MEDAAGEALREILRREYEIGGRGGNVAVGEEGAEVRHPHFRFSPCMDPQRTVK